MEIKTYELLIFVGVFAVLLLGVIYTIVSQRKRRRTDSQLDQNKQIASSNAGFIRLEQHNQSQRGEEVLPPKYTLEDVEGQGEFGRIQSSDSSPGGWKYMSMMAPGLQSLSEQLHLRDQEEQQSRHQSTYRQVI
jgi:type II secretory pathway pseudopilin PulG